MAILDFDSSNRQYANASGSGHRGCRARLAWPVARSVVLVPETRRKAL
jgi:hypothetical protein